MAQTLFLSPRFSQDSRILSDAASRLGWKVNRLPKWEIPVEIPNGELVVYGETLFARFIEQYLSLQLLDPPHNWLPELPFEARKRNVKLMNAGEARKISERCFIKPVDDKTFKASVMNSGNDIPAHLNDEEPVLVADAVKWNVEYRFFLLNGKVQTGSVYSRNGELDDEPGSEKEFLEAKQFAEQFAQELPSGVVIDTGIIEGKGWAVVEANPAWGSGLYNCDSEKALQVVAASCKRKR
jgi:hypothetical protein